MFISLAVCMMRNAISPRLATSIFLIDDIQIDGIIAINDCKITKAFLIGMPVFFIWWENTRFYDVS